MDDDLLLELVSHHLKEAIQGVRFGVGLTKLQQSEIRNTLSKHKEVLADIASKSNTKCW